MTSKQPLKDDKFQVIISDQPAKNRNSKTYFSPMKNLISILILLLSMGYTQAQNNTFDQDKLKEDLDEVISDIENHYVYLREKNIDLDCIKKHYQEQLPQVKNKADAILFFESLLNELYDSHIHLNTAIKSSYRLIAPIYTTVQNGKNIVSNVWQTQIAPLKTDIAGAEILKFNGLPFSEAIDNFPSLCLDKADNEIREWVANKVLAGKYNEPRILSLKLTNNKVIELDLDKINTKSEDQLLTSRVENEIGIIRVNNALGTNRLIAEFDKALDGLMTTKGLIIDLRNTAGGGNSYVARGIMSRFINKDLPYQKHVAFDESWDSQARVGRSWVEYVSPRGKTYQQPVVVLVGRWTGSMGEGLAIGFEGMERAEIVGSEMGRLAGAMYNFGFKHQSFGYSISKEKMYHLNGTAREKYVPTNYVNQTTIMEDQFLSKAMSLLHNSAQ